GYSMFDGTLPDGTPLLDALRARGITRLHVGGLATDYCVRATVLDGLKNGFAVELVADASRAVNVQPGDEQRAIDEMTAAGAKSETVGQFPVG
ncbi:MAG TPA: isochorismatase family protein, partial [Ktedonobacterales bacterium]